MKQVTLVAHYGQKRRDFESYVEACRQQISQSPMRRHFSPYPSHQIHGTIVGMEKLIGYSEPWNANIWRETGQRKKMDFDKLVEVAKEGIHFTVRFGGFNSDDKSIDSFGKTPYVRSFQFQWAQRKVTIMGWHHESGDFSKYADLWKLRKRIAEDCNVRHKFSDDKDFFAVIGDLVNLESLTDDELTQLKQEGERVEQAVRNQLAVDPKLSIDLRVNPDNVFVTQYEEETLALSSTRAHCITEPYLSATFISRLYEC